MDPASGLWTFDTRAVAPRNALDLWRTFIDEDATPTEMKLLEAGSFEGRLTVIGDQTYSTFELAASPHALIRSASEIRRGGGDLVFVILVNGGQTIVEQRDRSLLAHAGDILVLFMDVPFRVFHRGSRSVTGVRLPASDFPAALRDRTPILLNPRVTPTAAIAAAHLRWQPTDFETLDASRDLVKSQLVQLLCHCIDLSSRPVRSDERLSSAVKALVEAEIANPSLSAKLLCARLGVSRTVLFGALTASGDTLGNLVRERRLVGCRDDIMRTGGGDTLAAIAERWGFRDQSTFTRAFRRRFGSPPTKWNDAQRTRTAPPTDGGG